jgi:hypothetical protein
VKADIDSVGISGEILSQGLGGIFLPLHGQVRHGGFNDILVEGEGPFHGDGLTLEGEACVDQFLEILVFPEAQFDSTVSRDSSDSPDGEYLVTVGLA